MQQQPGALTRSRISSLLISRRLTRPRYIQFGLPAILNCSLATVPVSSDNYCVCHECVNVPEVGVATQNLSGAFRAPMAEPPSLNF